MPLTLTSEVTRPMNLSRVGVFNSLQRSYIVVRSACFHITSFLWSIFLKMGIYMQFFVLLTLTSKLTRLIDLSGVGVFEKPVACPTWS